MLHSFLLSIFIIFLFNKYTICAFMQNKLHIYKCRSLGLKLYSSYSNSLYIPNQNNYLIVGNWKMNNNLSTSLKLVKEIVNYKKEMDNMIVKKSNVELVLLPPMPFISDIIESVQCSNIYIGAQTIYHKENGPYTGAVSASMIHSIGCKYSLIGHSERRMHFKETDREINLMLKACHRENIKPILCLGENLEDYKLGLNKYICKKQLSQSLIGLNEFEIVNTIIAYEPIWAIGTGLFPSKEEIQEIHKYIRLWFYINYGKSIADKVKIIYGGSVNANNIEDILMCSQVNGILVGSSSLNASHFMDIYSKCVKYINA